MKGLQIDIHFTDYFNIDPEVFSATNAFNVSLLNDLPLFIDPFLLFNSNKARYRALHDSILQYVAFLRDKSVAGVIPAGLLAAWFTFPEVKQTWLGYSAVGNEGRGLGIKFAKSMTKNLRTIFATFGQKGITHGSHIEKLTLIEDGVGKDNISDFTTNLIKSYLLSFTQEITTTLVSPKMRETFVVSKVSFNYRTETWASQSFVLPKFQDGYVILCPRDLLTREEPWINKQDLIDNFEEIAASVPNEQLRHQVNNYFLNALPLRPIKRERQEAATKTIKKFPALIDFYILSKEENGGAADLQSKTRVTAAEKLFFVNVQSIARNLNKKTEFYKISGDTLEESRRRVEYLKRFIEHQGGHRLFYLDGEPIKREADLQLMYRLVWYGSESTVTSEANDGRGPADYKISRSSFDVSLVEFKLASNSQLRKNLKNQTRIYKKAAGTTKALIVIIYYTEAELDRVKGILKDLKKSRDPNIILIDCRDDNKPSGSKA